MGEDERPGWHLNDFPDKKCPVCGERYTAKLSDVYKSAHMVQGVPNDTVVHVEDGCTYVHPE